MILNVMKYGQVYVVGCAYKNKINIQVAAGIKSHPSRESHSS